MYRKKKLPFIFDSILYMILKVRLPYIKFQKLSKTEKNMGFLYRTFD